MTNKNKIISPIAIDMGAKNTGVLYAHYQPNSLFSEIDKQGEVLVYGDYTTLLVERTANRHVGRGYQRKKLAKRLLSIILKEYFNFPVDENAQALDFLMNRRGFIFLEEDYSAEHLNKFPEKSWQELSEEVKCFLDNPNNIAEQLMILAKDNPEKIAYLLEEIKNIEGYKKFQELNEQIKKETIYHDYLEKINKACSLINDRKTITDELLKKNNNDKKKLSETSNWIVERLNKENNLSFIMDSKKHQLDLTTQINQSNSQEIQKKIPCIKDLRVELATKKTKNNTSVWNFNLSEFKIDKKVKDLEENKVREHLHHFCYAVYKINNEILSGARHRTKYFNEIKEDLEKFSEKSFLNEKNSPNYLKNFILSVNNNSNLNIDKLWKLICHISNLPLKPLRSYFNDEKYKEGDSLNIKNLSKISSRWFMKHWIVTAEKDGTDKVADYKKLKSQWLAYLTKQDIIEFWLKTAPTLTIPPYEAMLNRHPPKCQTLLLNINYLNKNYFSWKQWLNLLNPNKEHRQQLKSIKAGKGRRLVKDEKIQAIQLQNVLDVSKKQDKYKLNQIWSIYHQWQKPSTINKGELKNKLKKLLEESNLPDKLKQDLSFSKFIEKATFGHFINKYYQTRRKARDGRYFLIQEKKERWLTTDKLLTLCSHKPRQKKHQWQIDLAAVLGITTDELKTTIKAQAPEEYFKSIKGFITSCEKADKAQKEHRGYLKIQIEGELLNKPKGGLAKLANNCYELRDKLSEKTNNHKILMDNQKNEIHQKVALVFKFAQIHNIVFKDRNGFSKTCPVCSTNNAFRMQKNDQGIVMYSRLPSLSIRLIDGLVMRICDAIARRVAKTKWSEIKKDLAENKEVSIPILIEQNKFEFEPSLQKMKGKTINITDDRENKYKGQKVSAYSGEPLGKNGEIDHIIPRSSKHGKLNDEANLIYISQNDNQQKGGQSKFLKDLHSNYKKEVFDTDDDQKIKHLIYDELEGDNKTIIVSDKFVFGEYLSYINLTKKQQKAFRHALFLSDSDLLRTKVINSLQNRRRTIVNGTQRYLAQCIADKIHRIYRKEGSKGKLSFDYFEYTAKWDDPNSTYNLRKEYGIDKPKKQPNYSHLIDAQLVFLLACEDHHNLGSLGIKIDDKKTIWDIQVDKSTGEILPSKFFNDIAVGEEKFETVDLSPKDSNQKIIDIERSNSNNKQELSEIFKRPIFKQNAIGERYKPIVKFANKWYIGYPMTIKGGIYNCDEYCQIIIKNNIKIIENIINDDKYYQLTTNNEQIKIWTIRKVNKKYKQIDKDSHKYFSKLNPKYTKEEEKEVSQIKFILVNCRYYVKKTNVINTPKILKKDSVKKYPFHKNWLDFAEDWKAYIGEECYKEISKGDEYNLSYAGVDKKWHEFCKKRFSPPKNQLKNRHQVKGKKYTMISIGTAPGTLFRINRNNQDIYQTLPLDTNIINKDRSNFLIKFSNNLALASTTPDKDLMKPISTEEKIKIGRIEFKKHIFFNQIDSLEKVKVYLNNTTVDIENFPLNEFKKYLFKNEYSKNNKFIKILTKNEIKNGAKTVFAYKEKIDKSINFITRDGSVTNIEIKEELVNFSLPFKKVDKILNQISKASDN